MNPKKLLKRFHICKRNRSNVEGVYSLIEQFVVPFRGDFFSDIMSEDQMDWRRRDIFDSTAIFANHILSSNVHAGLTNPVSRWFDIRFRDETLNSIPSVRDWCEISSQGVFWALQESNFNLEASECYLDLTSFGTSIVLEEAVEKKDRSLDSLDFNAAPIKECYYEVDHKSRVLYFYWEKHWTYTQIYEKFGDLTPSDITQYATDVEKCDQKEAIILCIFPRQGVDRDTPLDTIVPPNRRPFGYMYIREKDATIIGGEGGYYEMPAFVPRWRKTIGSMAGHSPAMICLSDILTLNQLVELILTAAEKVIDPPILTTRRGILGDLDLTPAGITKVASLESLQPFESKARFDVSQLEKEAIQNSIRQAFYVDQLQLKESPAMTATEVNVRYELMQRLLGPTLSRLQHDFLDPLIQRTFNILYRYGMIPEIPRAVSQKSGELDIEYIGPMARAQKGDQVAAIQGFMGDVAATAELFPEARDNVDVDEAVREIGNLRGIPAKILKEKGKVQTERKERNSKQEQERKLALAQGGASIVKDLSSAGGGVSEAAQAAIGGAGASQAA